MNECTRYGLYASLAVLLAVLLIDIVVYGIYAYWVGTNYSADLYSERDKALERVQQESQERMTDPVEQYKKRMADKIAREKALLRA